MIMNKKHTIWPADTPALTELSAINAALLKLYPDDFSLQLNAVQLTQLQKEHDAAITADARMDVLEELSWEFMGKTESEIKDIMFFKKLEVESLRSTPTTPGTQDGERK